MVRAITNAPFRAHTALLFAQLNLLDIYKLNSFHIAKFVPFILTDYYLLLSPSVSCLFSVSQVGERAYHENTLCETGASERAEGNPTLPQRLLGSHNLIADHVFCSPARLPRKEVLVVYVILIYIPFFNQYKYGFKENTSKYVNAFHRM